MSTTTVGSSGESASSSGPASVMAPARWLVVMAFAAIYLVWGSTFLGIRFAVESIPPLTMAGVRFLCAGLVLWLLSQRAGGSHDAPEHILGATPRQWRNALITGSLFFLGNHGLVSTAAKHIPSSLACLIIATEVPIIAVLSSLLLPNQPLTRRAIFGAALGISGVLWLFISQGASGATGTLPPSLAVLGASLCWSTGAVLSQRLDLPSNAIRRAGMQMTCGGLLLCLASLAKGEPFSIHWSEITMKSILAMAYLTTFGSILAFASYVWLLKHVRADAVATHVFVNPLVAIVLGSWLGGERLESAALVAGVLILCSVCIMTMRSSKLDTPEPA